jgi:radical SAM superfamily enzyme YgiQ (UPF0313 family)
MRIAMISPHDDRCYGVRIICSHLRRQGHEVWLIIFKQFASKPVTRDVLDRVRRWTPETFSPVTETAESGNYICCYIEPTTDTEWQLLLDKLTEIRPELIGVSLTTPSWPVARELTARVRREFSGVPIVWGGVHAQIAADKCVPDADVVCTGEGEHVMAELARDPARTDVVGTIAKHNGEIVRNPTRPLEQALDTFPFAAWGENESLIEWNRITPLPASKRDYFRGIYFTMTQRGCPYSCSYCFNHLLRAAHKGEKYVRRRSVDHALDECEQHARTFDLPGFMFMDDVFIKDREWLEEFAEKYRRRIGLPFGGYGHPFVTDEAMVRLLVDAGLRYMTIGVQSGSKYVAHQVYNRKQSFDKIRELAQWGAKYGLDVNYDLLSNCEFEREEDCLETLKFMTTLPQPRLIQVKGLGVFPPMAISQLDLPRPNLSVTTFEFWNTLYLMTRHRAIAAEDLLALSEDPYLKEHPEVLRGLAAAFKRLEDDSRANREQAQQAVARQSDVTIRGLLRYAKRLLGRQLPRPVADWIKALLSRLGMAEAPPH